jgi:osmotically-inducible protein OsmY
VNESGRTMAKLTLSMIAAAGLALSETAFLGRAATRADETAGQYIDNSVITTTVKAAILEEPSLKSFQISVKTNKDIVQLSGFVDSARNARRAGEATSGVKGVSSSPA